MLLEWTSYGTSWAKNLVKATDESPFLVPMSSVQQFTLSDAIRLQQAQPGHSLQIFQV